MGVTPEQIQSKLRSIDSTYKHGILDTSQPYKVISNVITSVDDILWGIKYKTGSELIIGLKDRLVYTEKNYYHSIFYNKIDFIKISAGTLFDDVNLKINGSDLIFSNVAKNDSQYLVNSIDKLTNQNNQFANNSESSPSSRSEVFLSTNPVSSNNQKDDIYIPEQQPTAKKKNKFKIGCLGTIAFVIIIGIVSILFSDSKEEKIQKANTYISEGNLSKAYDELIGSSDNEIVNLREDLLKVKDQDFKYQTTIIGEMTEEEFAQLKNGALKKEFISNPKLNEILLTSMTGRNDLDQIREIALQAKEKQRKNALRQKAESYFSKYDGSHRDLESAIKKNMNDPDSYEHIETKFTINYETEILTAITKFRGKNAFGGKVINSYIMNQNINTGQVISVDRL